MENNYQEISQIQCPNCGTEMNLIVEGNEKKGICENCGYTEPNYNNWLNQEVHSS